jgi:type IV pilus assembly protein PilV
MVVTKTVQSGMALLEALIGILIFSLGILAMIAMQAASVNAVADAQYRIEAVNAANQLLSQIWVSVDRTNAAKTEASTEESLRKSLLTFEHQTGGVPASCDFTGAPTSNATVKAWLDHLNTGGAGGAPILPGTKASMQQIEIDTGVSNRVTITLCWQAPNDTAPRRHTVVAYVN